MVLNRMCIPYTMPESEAGIQAPRTPQRRLVGMREIGAIAAYLISWLFCELVLGIQSGLLTLIISLLFAIGIYALIAVAGALG